MNLCERFGLHDRQILRGFGEYLSEKKILSSLMPLLNTISNIPISTSECERGFSQMNLIVTPTRASAIKHCSKLNVYKVGRPSCEYV
jgi:hypothetical protein